MKKIIILDFSDGQVIIRNIDFWEDPEDFIVNLGCNVKNCQWMIIEKLNLNIME